MEFRQLSTFATVARLLSFTKAAEELEYAQSSITAQIQALEAELQTSLFERLGKRVVLTDAGKRFLSYADRLLALADEARSEMLLGEEPGGLLTVGAPDTLCTYRLPLVLSRFRKSFPRVDVIFRPGACEDLRRQLKEGLVDISFVLEPPVTQTHLHSEPLISESLILITYPGHPLTRSALVRPEDLAGESLLLVEAHCTYRSLFERSLARASVRPNVVLEFGSIEAIKQCVMAGMGVTALPAVAVEVEVAQGRLIILPWQEDYGLVTQMVWHCDKRFSPALSAFIDLARSTFQEISSSLSCKDSAGTSAPSRS